MHSQAGAWERVKLELGNEEDVNEGNMYSVIPVKSGIEWDTRLREYDGNVSNYTP